ncbi:MAG: hypothetical protein WD295_02700 [Bacteroidota bacterium]
MMQRFPATGVLVLLMVSASAISAQSFYNLRDGFLDRKGKFLSMKLQPVEESDLTRTFDFLITSTRDSMTGRIRYPKGPGPHPAAFLTVGIETGKEVIEMIEGRENVILMAVDYPFEGEWNFGGLAAVGTTMRLRSMGFRTVPLLLNCLDWLFEQEAVKRDDVTLVAVSFGAFTGIPAAVFETRVRRLVVIQAGGSLSTVIAHNAKRWGTTLPGWLAGWLGGALLAPFEPTKFIPHLAPRELLMVNGKGDSFFPRESALALLDAAQEPKEIIWHSSDHIMPGEKEMIKELTNLVAGRIYGD